MFPRPALGHTDNSLGCQILQELKMPLVSRKHGLHGFELGSRCHWLLLFQTMCITLFMMEATSNNEDDAHKRDVDEVDIPLKFTRKANTSCRDINLLEGTIAKTCFSKLSLLARDTLMIAGLSIPSKSTFSKSNYFGASDCASLIDDNICIIIKL